MRPLSATRLQACQPRTLAQPAWYESSSYPLPSSTSSSTFLGYQSMRQEPFTPPVNPPPYGWHGHDNPGVPNTSTTTDAFTYFGVSATRQPACAELKNPPFFSGQDGPSIATSTSKAAFPGFSVPRRPPCKPPGDSGPPYSSTMSQRDAIIRSTSATTFLKNWS